MADQYDAIFDPMVYTAMRLVYEDSPAASKELKDMVLSALQSRSAASNEDAAKSMAVKQGSAAADCKALSDKISAQAKDEPVVVKDEFDFDDIPTSSIVIGGRKSAAASSIAPFADGCCVCQKQKNDSPDNKLFECTECHRIYHQNCHSPPIRNVRPDDPRFVWYCSDCSSVMETTTTVYNRPAAVARNTSTSNLSNEQAQWGTTPASSLFRRAPNATAQTAAPAPVKDAKTAKRRLPSDDD